MQFVDGATGQPLRGVNVTLVEDGEHWHNRFLDVHRHVDLPVTGTDGAVSLSLVSDWGNTLLVRAGGYRMTKVWSYHYPGKDSWYIAYSDKEVLVMPWTWGEPSLLTIPPHELRQIPLYRLYQPTPAGK